MPHSHTMASATGLVPVPVAVLLPPPGRRRDGHPESGESPDWYGVAPRDAAGLIARYSGPGDLVIELDAHPTITRAARHLARRATTAPTDGDGRDLPARPGRRNAGAGLILAALPRPGTDRRDLLGASATMQTWRAMLRPGGYLLTALTPPGPDLDTEHRPASYRATVIAAARTAGLTWQQEFLVLTAPLPDDEPRARPDTATAAPAALVDGRHRLAHVKVLAFRHETGDSDA
jgi:hypothetical protein